MTVAVKTSISIAIDLTDDFEREMLQFVEKKGNKSRYLKRLIYADMMGNIQAARAVYAGMLNSQVPQQEEPSEVLDAMKGFF